MTGAIRFPFAPADPAQPDASLAPLLPLTQFREAKQVAVNAFLDTGAAVNVLPYSIVVQLCLTWAQRKKGDKLPAIVHRSPSSNG
ncbi:MAG TPA: hypothetical protein VFJ58_16005 [Armatimonadota bacterium]|nr:hypothetical protein [Armatimonadota bacterium]